MRSGKKQAKIIADKMKKVAQVKSYSELGQLLGGISSASISGAIAKNKIPERWFEIIEERYGVTKESLFEAAEVCSEEGRFNSSKKQVDVDELLSVYRQLNEIRSELDEVRIQLNNVRIEKERLMEENSRIRLENEQLKTNRSRQSKETGTGTCARTGKTVAPSPSTEAQRK